MADILAEREKARARMDHAATCRQARLLLSSVLGHESPLRGGISAERAGMSLMFLLLSIILAFIPSY